MEKSTKQKILIVDDSEMNRSLLNDMLSDDFEIIEAENGEQALEIVNQEQSNIALMLLDIVMPKMDGFEVLTAMNNNGLIDNIPVIMITAESSSSYVERAFELGVTDFISRPFDSLIVKRRVKNTIIITTKQKRLVSIVQNQIQEKEQDANMMIAILSHLVEFRNGESGLHVLHIRVLTEILLKALVKKTNQYPLDQIDISQISLASALHDIGKITIPDKIINKPGKLTQEEFDVIKGHCIEGYNILDNLGIYRDVPFMKYAMEITRWHHEKFDGKGYPDGLVGDNIPISAQVVSLADVYDALTSVRCYKKAYTHEESIKMILNGECGCFNPILLECLVACQDEIRRNVKAYSLAENNLSRIKDTTNELLKYEGLNSSDRSIRLLEQERIKAQIISSMSNEIIFEYNYENDYISLSPYGAKKLNLKEIIENPRTNEDLKRVFGEEAINTIIEMETKTTSSNPSFQYEFELTTDHGTRLSRLICHTLWANDDEHKKIGSINKIVDIQEETSKIKELEHMVSHDMLTGLYNQNSICEIVDKKLLENSDKKYALILFDIDLFKTANDTYGHIFGNHVIQWVANNISKSIRQEDLAARVGGDEFLIFIQYNDFPSLKKFVDRIFKYLQGSYFDFDITVSMGISTTEMTENNYTSLFKVADGALYVSKKGGRKKYTFASKYDETIIKDTDAIKI